tara:strand:+ start:114 stop:725 length:612 start_codon:yes stop_codon:yes gene_type:complete
VQKVEAGLKNMQRLVHGPVQCITLGEGPVDAWINEESRLKGMRLNRWVKDEHGRTWDFLGPFFLAGCDYEKGETVSLTDEQIEKWLPRLELTAPELPEVPKGLIGVWHAKHPHFFSVEMCEGSDIRQPLWPHDFAQVAWVITEHLEHAWQQTNHISGPWQENEDVRALTDRARSSSVGDVFVLPGGKAMRVAGCGFVPVEEGN